MRKGAKIMLFVHLQARISHAAAFQLAKIYSKVVANPKFSCIFAPALAT